jgi:hypothetical protein
MLLSSPRILGKGDDTAFRILVSSPAFDNPFPRILQNPGILAPKAEYRKRPPQDLQRTILLPHPSPDRGILHGKVPGPSLKMVVPQDGSSHDGKISVGSQEHGGKTLQKGAYPGNTPVRDGHGTMLPREKYAMLMIVYVGRKLEIPGLSENIQGNKPVVAPLGVSGMPPVTGVFHTEKTGGVGGAPFFPGRPDVPRILFGFGTVDGDLQGAVGGGNLPMQIPGHQVVTDVEGVRGKPVKPVHRPLAPAQKFLLSKTAVHLGVSGSKHSHNPADELLLVQISPGMSLLPKQGTQFSQKRQDFSGGFEFFENPGRFLHSEKTEKGVAEG